MNAAYYIGKYFLGSVFALMLLIGIITTNWDRGRSPFMEHPLVLVILGLNVILLGMHLAVFARRYTDDWFNRVERWKQNAPRWLGTLIALWWWWSPIQLRVFSVIAGAFFAFVGAWLVLMGFNGRLP